MDISMVKAGITAARHPASYARRWPRRPGPHQTARVEATRAVWRAARPQRDLVGSSLVPRTVMATTRGTHSPPRATPEPWAQGRSLVTRAAPSGVKGAREPVVSWMETSKPPAGDLSPSSPASPLCPPALSVSSLTPPALLRSVTHAFPLLPAARSPRTRRPPARALLLPRCKPWPQPSVGITVDLRLVSTLKFQLDVMVLTCVKNWMAPFP